MRDAVSKFVDYKKTYREFKWEIPEYYNFGFDGIDRWAEDRTRLALISVDDTGLNFKGVAKDHDRQDQKSGVKEQGDSKKG